MRVNMREVKMQLPELGRLAWMGRRRDRDSAQRQAVLPHQALQPATLRAGRPIIPRAERRSRGCSLTASRAPDNPTDSAFRSSNGGCREPGAW